MIIHFDVGREKSISALEESMLKDSKIFLVSQIDPEIEDPKRNEIYSIGTICKIKQILKLPKGVTRVLVEGVERAAIIDLIDDKKFKEVIVEKIDDELNLKDENEDSALRNLLSKAFKEYIEANNLKILDVEKFEDISGYGIVGTIDNNTILVGNSKLLNKYKIENKYIEQEELLATNGNSIVYIAKNNEILGIIGVNDIIRGNAKNIIEELNKNNIEVMMLTGDNKKTAKSIADTLEIKNVIANVTPNEKSNIIKKLKDKGKIVMMCGDGINDSPALALSDIGVSVNSGTDIARDSSDVILTKNDLTSIMNLINISKKTIRNIKQNLFWAFFYNSLMIPIAMGVLSGIGININPMIASLAMVLSSFTVILNALRLKKIKM